MLKELYMALEMVKAARTLQTQLGALKSIVVRVKEDGKTKMTVSGEDYYVFFDPMKPTGYETMCEDAIIVWNYCNCKYGYAIQHTDDIDVDESSYSTDFIRVGGVDFIYIDYR